MPDVTATYGTLFNFIAFSCFSLLIRSMRKVYHILLNQLLAVTSQQKVPEACELYFWKDFLYVCAYVCVYLCMCALYRL